MPVTATERSIIGKTTRGHAGAAPQSRRGSAQTPLCTKDASKAKCSYFLQRPKSFSSRVRQSTREVRQKSARDKSGTEMRCGEGSKERGYTERTAAKTPSTRLCRERSGPATRKLSATWVNHQPKRGLENHRRTAQARACVLPQSRHSSARTPLHQLNCCPPPRQPDWVGIRA